MAEITQFEEKTELKLHPLEEGQIEERTRRPDGRLIVRKSVQDDKLRGVSSLADGSISSASMFASGVIDQTAIGANAVGQSELKYEQVSVTVNAGSSTGTATVTSGSIVIGWRATGNQDQFIDNISVSGTTLTVTLATNATADNTFQITLLKS